jgi:hypothetical protein
MNKTDEAVAKLQSIQQLWIDLGRTQLNIPEYKKLMGQIRVLSAEYQAIANAPDKSAESK